MQLRFHSLVYKWHFPMLISSKIHSVPCLKCYYYINILITFFALPFQKFWKMKLGEILVYSYICLFYFLFFNGLYYRKFYSIGQNTPNKNFLTYFIEV